MAAQVHASPPIAKEIHLMLGCRLMLSVLQLVGVID